MTVESNAKYGSSLLQLEHALFATFLAVYDPRCTVLEAALAMNGIL